MPINNCDRCGRPTTDYDIRDHGPLGNEIICSCCESIERYGRPCQCDGCEAERFNEVMTLEVTNELD